MWVPFGFLLFLCVGLLLVVPGGSRRSSRTVQQKEVETSPSRRTRGEPTMTISFCSS
jgi:hypothetical protein